MHKDKTRYIYIINAIDFIYTFVHTTHTKISLCLSPSKPLLILNSLFIPLLHLITYWSQGHTQVPSKVV